MEIPTLDALLMAVRTYDDFNEDNDPYDEHDFGALDWESDRVFWKLNYFDKTHSQWEDPLSPDCERVLTVMLSEEY